MTFSTSLKKENDHSIRMLCVLSLQFPQLQEQVMINVGGANNW